MDITALKRAQERTRFLMREVNHRSKNLLSVVQAIAKQTAAEAAPRAFADRFGERLQGLAATQDLLIRNDWRGADMEQLIRSQLTHFADLFDGRIQLRGPPLSVTAAAAQNLGLALHELATNAGKYGALSSIEGELSISWRIVPSAEGPKFQLRWQEKNGPPVSPPARRGLGSLLITRITENALEGKVGLAFDLAGIRWELEAPLGNVSVQSDHG
jgi:two-component sensor histidine kinase